MAKRQGKKLDLQAVTLSQLSTIVFSHSRNSLYQERARAMLVEASVLIENAAMTVASVEEKVV